MVCGYERQGPCCVFVSSLPAGPVAAVPSISFSTPFSIPSLELLSCWSVVISGGRRRGPLQYVSAMAALSREKTLYLVFCRSGRTECFYYPGACSFGSVLFPFSPAVDCGRVSDSADPSHMPTTATDARGWPVKPESWCRPGVAPRGWLPECRSSDLCRKHKI